MYAFCHTCVENPLKGPGKGMLKATASVYDPQGIALLLLLIAKQFYRKTCDFEISWDKELPKTYWRPQDIGFHHFLIW